MSDEKRHEPPYHKRDTLRMLLEARAELAKATALKDDAERAVVGARAKVESLECDTVEWLRREKASVATLIVSAREEAPVVAVFRVTDHERVLVYLTEPAR